MSQEVLTLSGEKNRPKYAVLWQSKSKSKSKSFIQVKVLPKSSERHRVEKKTNNTMTIVTEACHRQQHTNIHLWYGERAREKEYGAEESKKEKKK